MDHLLNWLWQGTLLAAFTTIASRLGHRLPAARRHDLWWALLVAVVLLPVFAATAVPGGGPPAPVLGEPAWGIALPVITADLAPLVVALWAAVFVWRSVRLASAVVATRRVRQGVTMLPPGREERLPLWQSLGGQGRACRLVVSDAVHTAAVLGGLTPMIALSPRLLEALDDRDLDRVILHEWAHAQRRDDWLQFVQQLLRAAFGLHPAVWWASRQLSLEREVACDESVVRVTGSARSYAECLLKLAVCAPASTGGLRPAAVVRPQVATRIQRLASARPRPRRAAVFAWTTAAAMAIAASSLVLAQAPVFRAPGSAVPERPSLEAGPAAVRYAPPMPDGAVRIETSSRSAPDILRAIDFTRAVEPGLASPDAPLSDAVQARQDRPPRFETDEPASAAVPSWTPPALEAQSGADSLPGSPASLAPPPLPAPGSGGSDTPWSAAADAGLAIGYGSTKAARATAGFFTRIGKSIGRSF